ncbi:endolytic transglycosylase MltG [Nocardioides daeguensis]|uniref:Endolytic murein transglycosylase n=1 Tax=Nocardioides daeguensis TaxID=908359 RepID=A0ABP6VXC9_9ACTN|nr:endolytic transglycosylase MltG [Nocardioides daeguensis]MBV6726835.1 endolytic transglycosylase MltG [Nocardioides daeguensis]MCR1774413.1 endolytic transglycosylase MltG [Nocardioides daeguensis]
MTEPLSDNVAPDDAVGHDILPVSTPAGGRRRAAKKRRGGCLPILLVAVLFCGLVAWFARGAIADVKDMLAGPEDFAGPGQGQVTFVIDPGQSVGSMGAELEDLGVVASSEAFVDAAAKDSRSTRIQAGTYLLKSRMKAADVVAILVDPSQMAQDTVTIPEGKRTSDIVKILAKNTDFKAAQFEAVLADPAALGLPPSAGGNPEGYLFPATYTITPADTPQTILAAMVAKGQAVMKDLDLDAQAQNVGLTAHEVLTVASMLEFEANRDQDYPKVARAIYNRLDQDMALQSDATVAYANGLSGEVWTTSAQRDIDSPYNTYANRGLPPGPIGNPGEATIDAALHPADGPWLYWVVVNLKTGETVFSTTLAEHNAATERLREYCTTSDAC